MADLTAMLQAAAGQAGEDTDPFFNQTTLLLHGDGTNGAQNNTFLDSSTNNFTITRNGNTTQGTFSPFSLAEGEWSNFFDGTGDYLSFANNAALNPGTDDFVMECWVYLPVATGVNQGFNGKGTPATDGYTLFVDGSLVLTFIWNGAGGATITAGTLSLNTWHHVAVVRNSSVIRLYLDGVGAASSTACTTNITSTATKYVGQARGGSEMTGYLSNYRMVKGALPSGYDATSSSLTLPTAPLTAISGTSLLTCQSNRFVDNSTNAFAITVNGNTSVQPFSPFAPSAAYSTSVNGGSGYFDGTGDYLTTASSSNLALGSGDFTVDVWFYPTTTNTYFPIDFRTGTSFYFYVSSGTTVNVAIGSNSETTFTGVVTNAWNHFACVRSGGGSNNVSYYLNGVRGAQQTDTTNFSSATTITLGKRYVAFGGNEFYFAGYLGSVRSLVGTALYSGTTYAVPTAPLTAVSGTELLLNFTNAGIFDNTGKNNLETVGDAQIDTSVKKWGTGSLEFDGNGDYLFIKPTPDNQVGSGDFTVEGWFYANSPVPQFGYKMFGQSPSGTNFFVITAGEAGGANTNVVSVIIDNTVISSTATFTTGTWNHFAVVRSSGDVKVYLNGSGGSATTKTTNIFNLTYNITIGSHPANANERFNGYIDDFRITKGVARYTANFTPPTAAFPDL